MNRWFRILCLILMAVLLWTVMGCTQLRENSTDSNGPATSGSTNPLVDSHSLNGKMYCTTISLNGGTLGKTSEAEVDIRVTKNEDGEDTFSLNVIYLDDEFPNLQYPQNHFQMKQLDPDLPFVYALGDIYSKLLDAYSNFDFLVDFENGYMLYMERSMPRLSYTVATVDPNEDPLLVLAHFSAFLEQYAYPMPVLEEDYFYYDLTGAWFSQNGELQSKMDFSIIGNLPKEYKDGDFIRPEMTFLWPESFGYENNGTHRYHTNVRVGEDPNSPQFFGNGLLHHPEKDELVSFAFNIFPKEEVVILYMKDQYLVASAGGEEPGLILDRYRDYLYTKILKTVNWTMDACFMRSDGMNKYTLPITIQGSIEDFDKYAYLNLEMNFGDDFRYFCTIPDPYGYIASHFLDRDDTDRYMFSAYTYDGIRNEFVTSIMGLHYEKGYFIMDWRDAGQYLVACIDPEVEYSEVLDYFEKYLARWK